MPSSRFFVTIASTVLLSACGEYYGGPNYQNQWGGDGGLDDGGVGPSNLLLTIEFNGVPGTCAAAGINQFNIAVQGVMLNPSIVLCQQGNATLEVYDLPTGTASVTVQGLLGNTVVYSGTQAVTLTAGDNQATLNLLSVTPDAGVETDAGIEPDAGGESDAGQTDAGPGVDAGTSFNAQFLFGASHTSIPEGMTCAQAGVQSVTLSIDSAPSVTVPCPSTGATTIQTTAGTHNFSWTVTGAADAGAEAGVELYSAAETGVVISAGTNNNVNVDFAGLVNGGVEVQWGFAGSANCATVSAATVTYDVADALGNELPGMPATAACGSGNFTISATPGLAAGDYALVYMKAQDVSGNVVASSGPEPLYAPAGSVATFNATLSP